MSSAYETIKIIIRRHQDAYADAIDDGHNKRDAMVFADIALIDEFVEMNKRPDLTREDKAHVLRAIAKHCL